MLNQLPSVGAAQASGVANGATGTAEVDLRYLGAKRSLVLVNGRRLMPGDPNSTNQSADLNVIPAALVRRAEVLTGGASSVYGADAVAGVVNFIMDTEFEGVRFDGNFSIWQHKQDDPSVSGGLHMSDIIGARQAVAGEAEFPLPTGSTTDGRSIDGTITVGAGFDDGRGHAVAYFGYRHTSSRCFRPTATTAPASSRTRPAAFRAAAVRRRPIRARRSYFRATASLDPAGARPGNDRSAARTSTTSRR